MLCCILFCFVFKDKAPVGLGLLESQRWKALTKLGSMLWGGRRGENAEGLGFGAKENGTGQAPSSLQAPFPEKAFVFIFFGPEILTVSSKLSEICWLF